VTETRPSFLQRLLMAIVCLFRIVADADFASRIRALNGPAAATERAEPDTAPAVAPSRDVRPALQLLSALQREGRLVDFIQQDIATFSDADVGAAARVVHDGCRRALQHIVQMVPVHEAAEGHSVTVASGFDPTSLSLSGAVSGSPPFRGTLRHRGWRARGLALPDIIGDSDCTVIAPAEIEL
jgi:hypothetical protein